MTDQTPERPIRSMRDFCKRYYPASHAAKTCGCYPKAGVLVILPKPGVGS